MIPGSHQHKTIEAFRQRWAAEVPWCETHCGPALMCTESGCRVMEEVTRDDHNPVAYDNP